jgi:two-component system copper resistance phosphate regulon response regulator CusR
MAKRKILVVEDDPATCQLIGQILKPVGAEVDFDFDGVDALTSLVRSTPDLIILDIALPRLDGWHVLDALRRRGVATEVPVIVITAHGQGSAADRALTGGADRFFEKPFSPSDLLAAVQELLPADS